MKINKFQKWVLTYIAKKLVVQGPDHRDNVIEYFKIIRKACQEEFTEDSLMTTDTFLFNCFDKTCHYRYK